MRMLLNVTAKLLNEIPIYGLLKYTHYITFKIAVNKLISLELCIVIIDDECR